MPSPQVVIDTNVIYTTLHSHRGLSFRLIDDFMTGKASWKWNISNSCILEYEEVLVRATIPLEIVTAFLADLVNRATPIWIPSNLRPIALDPDDDIFAELALAAGADYLVTFNVQHLSPVRPFGIAVVTPAEFHKIIERQ
jgi:predicted nucleic acid-binding protein